ncbi:precorrin-3B synthase [Streptomyces sp. KL109B]
MSPSPISPGTGTSGDACPGALRLHSADDGFLARVRIPGGVLSARQARALRDAAGRLGDGMLHLTSRGNVQLRGLRDGCGSELAEVLGGAGLLPSAAHERVRNVVASPMSGLDGRGFVDVREWLTGLDAALCASSVTPGLSGRFLFALDDGRGDVAGLGADVLVRGVASGEAEVCVGAVRVRVPYEWGVRVAVGAAEGFVAVARGVGGRVWRVADLGAARRELEERVLGLPGLRPRGSAPDPAPQTPAGLDVPTRSHTSRGSAPDPAPQTPAGLDLPTRSHTSRGSAPSPAPQTPAGLERTRGSGPVFTVPLGVLGPKQWGALVDVARRLPEQELRLTPWRGVVVPGAGPAHAAELTRTGLVADPDSPWTRVAACVGRPGCAKAHADVRAEAAARIDEAHPELPTYWSGCERRCGHPAGDYVDIVARPDGGYTTNFPHHTES